MSKFSNSGVVHSNGAKYLASKSNKINVCHECCKDAALNLTAEKTQKVKEKTFANYVMLHFCKFF